MHGSKSASKAKVESEEVINGLTDFSEAKKEKSSEGYHQTLPTASKVSIGIQVDFTEFEPKQEHP